MQETLKGLSNKNLARKLSRRAGVALRLRAQFVQPQGYLPLQQRSWAESMYWLISRRIQKMAKELDYFPEELRRASIACYRTPASAPSLYSKACRIAGR